MSVEKIIQEALDQNPLGLKEAFAEEIIDRIKLALEAKKSEMEKDDDDEDEDEDDLDEAASGYKVTHDPMGQYSHKDTHTFHASNNAISHSMKGDHVTHPYVVHDDEGNKYRHQTKRKANWHVKKMTS